MTHYLLTVHLPAEMDDSALTTPEMNPEVVPFWYVHADRGSPA